MCDASEFSHRIDIATESVRAIPEGAGADAGQRCCCCWIVLCIAPADATVAIQITRATVVGTQPPRSLQPIRNLAPKEVLLVLVMAFIST